MNTQAVSGTVLDQAGKPLAGVRVRAFQLDESPLTAQLGGGSLVANNGGSFVSDQGAGLTGKVKSVGYRLAAAEGITDAAGLFSLTLPGGLANIEAVGGPQAKAMALRVVPGTQKLVMRLAPPGTLRGQLASDVPGVSNFEGVDVYVPGTGYSGKADRSGAFSITGIAAGQYEVVAEREGLGKARLAGVEVLSDATRDAGTLLMTLVRAVVTGITPAVAVPGATLMITGTGFGASAGRPLLVTIDGRVVQAVERLTDESIRVTAPPDLARGPIQVAVAGVLSDPFTIRVVSAITLIPPVLSLAVGATTSLKAVGRDTDGGLVQDLAVDWRATGAADVDAAGRLTGRVAGAAGVEAVLGPLKAGSAFLVGSGARVVTLAGGEKGRADGPGGLARFATPEGVAAGADGTVFVADSGNHTIRAIAPDGTVRTLAGSGKPGMRDGPGAEALFSRPTALVQLPDGALVVVDAGNNRLRLVAPDGSVSTFAGGDEATRRDGPLAAARFGSPYGIARAEDGTLWVSEWLDQAVRKLSPAGDVTTVAGGGGAGDSDGVGAAAHFNGPAGLALASDGSVWVADFENNRIRRIAVDGTVSTVAGGPRGYADGTAAEARFALPLSLAADADGSMLVADFANHRIRRVTQDGVVTTVAGGTEGDADGPALAAGFRWPAAIATGPAHTYAVVEKEGHRVRLWLP